MGFESVEDFLNRGGRIKNVGLCYGITWGHSRRRKFKCKKDLLTNCYYRTKEGYCKNLKPKGGEDELKVTS